MLTTQYLDEAERLADDIIVIDHGRIIAQGDARSLKREVGGDHLQVVVVDAGRLADASGIVATVTGLEPRVDVGRPQRPSPRSVEGVDALAETAKALADAAIAVDDLSLRQPTLDEVFLDPHRVRPGRRRARGGAVMTVTTTDVRPPTASARPRRPRAP